MTHFNPIKILCLPVFLLIITGCSKNPDDTSFNVFSVEDDISLGAQVDAEIQSDPDTYPLLDRKVYPEAYNYLDAIVDEILEAGNVFYKDRFEWKVSIIHNDSVLNAFATPGGYIYVYTGLIHFLEAEDQLAGVIGHEMAHADRRHSTDQLTKAYGLAVLLEVALGKNQGLLSDIAASLLTLKFSRDNEREADEYSVRYLCPTEYEADGSADFFQKVEDQGGSSPPEFLSTHPNPENRIEAIQQYRIDLECNGDETRASAYALFKSNLP